MKTKRLDYNLPKELIAQAPISPRDKAKLLYFDKKEGVIKHSKFSLINEFLRPGDLLIFNKSKVFKARLFAENLSGKKIEIFFLSEIKLKLWEVLVGGGATDGEEIYFNKTKIGIIKKDNDRILLKTFKNKLEILNFLNKWGHVPLPPYIKREDNLVDKKEYQTVFAEKEGSAAAPTAGLHFTKKLISKLKKQKIEIEYVTLHVGLGTFLPIKTEIVENHPIHSEYFEIDKKTITAIKKAKKEKRRIIACGTTSVRVLESIPGEIMEGREHEISDSTSIFIYPGYKFQIVDGLITNFHTPKSSLLALVFAFVGENNIKNIYKEGINKRYRFFSYGDGMILFR